VPDGGPVRFDGRVAVVTGSGRGLGRQTALFLAARGAAVVVNDVGVSADAARYGEDPCDDPYASDVAYGVVDEIEAAGGRAVANVSDVANPISAASAVADAVRSFGRVDIVINNAGVVVERPFEELTTADMTTAWSVDVGGAFHVLKAAWQHMREQGYGRVVNVGSSAGFVVGHPAGYAAYDVANGGLAGMTRALAAEGAPLGILVNALLPSAVTRSHIWDEASGGGGIDFDIARVAPVAAWLAHENCRVHGRFFAAGAGRVGEVYTSAASGYQCPQPSGFSLEYVRDNWTTVKSTAGSVSPTSSADYNAFRVGIYDSTVV
jgi:NAD(P)-dependent dehydrogenase (short-subunit alcohol dehydrogenase family)